MDIPGTKNSVGSNYKGSLGKWTAMMKTGRKVILVVRGIIPTDKENHSFTLKVADRQDIDPLVLVLELTLDVAVLDGTSEVEVYYTEILDRYDQYTSVLVNGNGRQLAFFGIEGRK